MVDTTRVKQLGIGRHGRKTDRIDAEVLATALKVGRIPQAHILSPTRQEPRFHLAARRMLVENRAQYLTAIREIVRARGGRLGSCATRFFLEKLADVELGEQTGSLVGPLRSALES
jgi:transposase